MTRVVELSETAAGAFAGLLLAEVGAEVIKVEPPQGSSLRRTSEATGEPVSVFLDRRKKAVTADLPAARDRAAVLALVASADILIQDLPVGTVEELGLSWKQLAAEHPNLVYVSISPFGQEGPRARWKASELVMQAMGGVVSSTGWDDGSPQRLPGNQAAYVAGLHAAAGALAAALGVTRGTSPGAHLDVSVQEAMATYATRDIHRFVYTGQDVQRFGHEHGMQGWPPIAEASDGFVMLEALRAEWEGFAYFLGLDDRFLTHEFSDPAVRAARWNEILPDFERAVRQRTKHEWLEASAKQGYTFAPVDDLVEVLASPQLKAREFFRDVEGTSMPAPRLPFTHAFEQPLPNRPPSIGEHNQEIWVNELGLGDEVGR